MYLNSFLEEEEQQEKRRVRRDKKKDIRVPVDDFSYKKLFLNSKRLNKSMTEYASILVGHELMTKNYFEKLDYQQEFNMTHVKLLKHEYDMVCDLAAKWRCSVREATHTVLYTALQKVGVS